MRQRNNGLGVLALALVLVGLQIFGFTTIWPTRTVRFNNDKRTGPDVEGVETEADGLRPIDQIPSPQKGVAFRVIGFAITLPLTWFLLSFVDSALGVIVGATVVAVVAVWTAVALGSQKRPTR